MVGQVTVPLVCVSSSVKAKARVDGGLLNVNVLFALMVLVKKLPNEQLMSRAATAVKLPRTGPS